MITLSNPQPVGARYADRIRVAEISSTVGDEALPYDGQWAGGTNYGPQRLVTYSGVCYVSLQAANQGKQPDQNPLWWSANVGLDLKNLAAVGVALECATGQVIGANAALQAYVVNPATGIPWRAPGFDPEALTQGLGGQVMSGLQITGPAGRLLMLPSKVGVACNLFLSGIPMPGLLQS